MRYDSLSIFGIPCRHNDIGYAVAARCKKAQQVGGGKQYGPY